MYGVQTKRRFTDRTHRYRGLKRDTIATESGAKVRIVATVNDGVRATGVVGWTLPDADDFSQVGFMYIELLAITNFRCFGPDRTVIELDSELTVFIGSNGAGKTAACHALRRLFGISTGDRTIEAGDFHVPPNEPADIASRDLRIEVIVAFPELAVDNPDAVTTVPEFFRRMAAESDGTIKCRFVLDATWEADGTVDGTIDVRYRAVRTFDDTFTDDDCEQLRPADRTRIQMVYVPPNRNGARQVSAFLQGRLWRAARWSAELRELVANSAEQISSQFHSESPTKFIEQILSGQWQKLQGAGTHATPVFQPLEPDVTTLLRSTELVFQPDHSASSRAAEALSDGQRSLLHLALTAATVEAEAALATGSQPDAFDVTAAHLPVLTLFVVEEPENSLAPFYLSRILGQILALSESSRAQGLLSSHSASALSRIDPRNVRHFRLDPDTAAAAVRPIDLPEDNTDAAKFIREAVCAHPELYFARCVILGEGDTEELVIPRIARARGVELDPSFVAMVPLGGRHTNHFWRLLHGLDIPHATLVDLDYGRADGGPGRLKDACTRLVREGVDVFDRLEEFDSVEDLAEDMTQKQMMTVMMHLQSFGVFFSSPLDLDMSMLAMFTDAYKTLETGEKGPASADAFDVVLGTGGSKDGRAYWTPTGATKLAHFTELLRWYRYLFLTRSKPATHLRALSTLTDEQLADRSPKYLNSLIDYVQQQLDR